MINFSRFPLKKPLLMKLWMEQTGLESHVPINANNARVCSLHFSPEDFRPMPVILYNNRRRLSDWAVPNGFQCKIFSQNLKFIESNLIIFNQQT